MIYVDDRQDNITINEEEIEELKKVINHALLEEKVDVPYEISLLFVNKLGIILSNFG